MNSPFAKLLCGDAPVLLDGAMGTMLLRAGVSHGGCPESLNLTRPDLIEDIHRAYLNAGSRLIYANTFGATPERLARAGLTPEAVIRAGVGCALRAAAPFGACVAVDLGPTGKLVGLSDRGAFDAAYETFREMAVLGERAGAHCAVIETMTDLAEMRAAVLAVREHTQLPILATLSFEADGRTFTGVDARAMALTLSALGVAALGVNCSLGPDLMGDLVARLLDVADCPIVLKPNAGLPNAQGRYDMTPSVFADWMARYARQGVRLLGGCCGTSPAFIEALAVSLDGVRVPERAVRACSDVCSATRAQSLDGLRVVGERLNPTGKKRLQAALRAGALDELAVQAVSQQEAGAEILDVNVGLPGMDEPETMARVVARLQGATDLPLQLDSADPAALERGLRAYHGVAIVNSVNGDPASLSSVLPPVKRYGARVIGLTLDERGLPKTADERLSIARRIRDAARAYGIPDAHLLIDCLTLTVSAEPLQALETLEAVRRVRAELGLKTVLGVSNISFGLPSRPVLSRAFLAMAAGAGLNLCIVNPNDAQMMDELVAARLLLGQDDGARAYIERAQRVQPLPVMAELSETRTLAYAIEHGLPDLARALAEALLKDTNPIDLVEAHVIPALDRVGERFERGACFLPQLIRAAEAAQGAFEAVKAKLRAAGAPSGDRGRILLATVQGDIHDIGKNIVRVILENYGYDVVDLGRDVPPLSVVQAAREKACPLVGLSALMTTTVPAMAKTIAALRESLPATRVFVGGAVLSPALAASLGADDYAKDARAAVAIARDCFGR